MDVKSLFKSGKKTIKAFKIATGPTSDAKTDAKAGEESLEAWEAPVVAQPAQSTNLAVGLDDYKGEEELAMKPSVSWSNETAAPAAVEEKPMSASSYIPPSQRRAAEAAKSLPTLADAVKLTTAKPAAAGPTATGARPSRLVLTTSATKRAQEEEERKKEEDRKRKEAEKQARREELKAQMESQTAGQSSAALTGQSIKAAPLDQIYAKYVGRVKTGRKLTDPSSTAVSA